MSRSRSPPASATPTLAAEAPDWSGGSATAGRPPGPVMFEIPFDLIVAFRLQIPDPVALYRLP